MTAVLMSDDLTPILDSQCPIGQWPMANSLGQWPIPEPVTLNPWSNIPPLGEAFDGTCYSRGTGRCRRGGIGIGERRDVRAGARGAGAVGGVDGGAADQRCAESVQHD